MIACLVLQVMLYQEILEFVRNFHLLHLNPIGESYHKIVLEASIIIKLVMVDKDLAQTVVNHVKTVLGLPLLIV